MKLTTTAITTIISLLFTLNISAMVTEQQWSKYADDMKGVPGLVRFYSFTTADATQSNRCGISAEMKLVGTGDKTATVMDGRITGLTAVALDEASFRAPALTEIEKNFTVSLWLKPDAAGIKQKDGHRNGMISSSGSGYYDGWRLAVYDMETFTPSFEIGCSTNSVKLQSFLPLSRGFWNHLAASWDGEAMKIFVNGMLAGTREFAGPSQPAKGDLAVGFTGFGVGSLKMGVDELAIFNRALFPGEIAALSISRTTLPDAASVVVNSSCALAMAHKTSAAKEELKKISTGEFPLPLKLWAKTAAIFLSSKGDNESTNIGTLCSVYDNPELPTHLKGALLVKILQACRLDSSGIPSSLLERLPAEMNLNDDDKFICAVALAQSYINEKKYENAVKIFEHLIAMSKHDSSQQKELGFKYGQALREIADYDGAGKQYASVANNMVQPSHVRSIAALALAQTYIDQKKYDLAISACETIGSASTVLPHHKFEADEMIRTCENLKEGLAPRDPEAYRSRLDPLPQSAITFFVAPKGSDINPGTIKKPFATLIKARDEIRKIKNIGGGGLPVGGVTVYLRGGEYRLASTLELTKGDSGKYGAPVVYSAWKDEKPVFSGGFKVRKFRKVRDDATLARLPEAARGKVYVADLKAQGYKSLEPQQGYGFGVNNETIRSVYADGQFLEIARWPNDTRIPMAELIKDNDRAFKVESDRLVRWTTAQDLMVDGFWYHLWAGEALHVEGVDPENSIITLAKKPGRGFKQGRPFYVMNLLEEIDQPGEWYIDCKSGLLYIWPRKHPWFTDIVVSERQEHFIRAREVQDLVLQGLTFQYGQDRAAAFNNCVNLTISGCHFHGFGGTALTVLNAANAKIYGNKLDTLGHGGMHVTGGNRKNLTASGIQIENNEVGYFGLCSKTYVPAILLEGVGTTVRHNWFHHAPSSAMRIEGNDHLVEYNLTEFVVTESDDQGGIDMWSNASYRGCVMRYNIWRDIRGGEAPCGQSGIRFDDAISGMVVYGNIFERSSNGSFGGVQIHGGHMNIIDNNIFIDCNYAVSFSPWSLQRFQNFITEQSVDKLHTEVNIDLPPYSDRYPSLIALKDDSMHNVNSVWRNIIAGTDTPFYRPPKGTDLCENHIVKSYSPDSTLIKNSTFRAIPVAEIGLYADPACAW